MNDQKTRRRRSNKILSIIICLLPFLAIVSCSKPEAYLKFEHLKGAKWQQTDTLRFSVDSSAIDTGRVYRLSVEVTNNNNYPYSDLWLSVGCHGQHVDSIRYDMPGEFVLTDDLGKWGGAGFGSLYQTSFLLNDSLVFPVRQNYEFTIIHAMTDNPLNGIESIGLKITEVD